MIGKCRTPENLTIGSHEPVQTGRATPLGTRGSLHTSVLVHIRSCIRLSISLSSPTDGECTHTCPQPTLREKRKDVSAVWVPLHSASPHLPAAPPPVPRPPPRPRRAPATPARAPLGRPFSRAGCSRLLLTPPGAKALSFNPITHIFLSRQGRWLRGPGVNECTTLHTLAGPRSRQSSVGLTRGAGRVARGPCSDLAQSGLVQKPQGRLHCCREQVCVSVAGRVACHPQRTGRRQRQESSVSLALKSGKTNNKTPAWPHFL